MTNKEQATLPGITAAKLKEELEKYIAEHGEQAPVLMDTGVFGGSGYAYVTDAYEGHGSYDGGTNSYKYDSSCSERTTAFIVYAETDLSLLDDGEDY